MPGLIFTQKHLKATAKSEFKNKHKEKLFWGQLSSLTQKKNSNYSCSSKCYQSCSTKENIYNNFQQTLPDPSNYSTTTVA